MTTREREFRARWGEEMESRGADDWASRMVQGEIMTLMSELQLRLGQYAVITLTARHPDGSRDTIVTNDPLQLTE